MNVTVVGLGKLGAPLAAVLASKGHSVIGTDVNEAFVAKVNAGQAPVDEPQLQELIDAHRSRLRAVSRYEDAVPHTDMTFLVVPTPSDEHGVFTNRFVIGAIEQVGRALQRSSKYHVVVVTSTVMPGSTGGEIREALERASGRTVGEDLGLCYNPEFIALGSVVRNMLFPDFILIGESDARAGSALAAVYEGVCANQPPIRRMNFVNAELTKISVNTFVTTKISYANMLADMCDRLPGADVDVVTEAVGSDSRVGQKYLRGALGYGGPCFPRDNVAFAALARRIGARPDIAEATDRINAHQVERVAETVSRRVAAGAKVSVLGLSYKPHTAVIDESPALAIVRRLAADGYRLSVFDPLANEAARPGLPASVTMAVSAEACVQTADAVIIATPWPQFARLSLEALSRPSGRPIVFDFWRVLPANASTVADIVYPGTSADVTIQAAGTVA
jgi:UDPglucose 6-dehydrogenase